MQKTDGKGEREVSLVRKVGKVVSKCRRLVGRADEQLVKVEGC